MKITHEMTEWLANGERGISSNTIFTCIAGTNALGEGWSSYPLDPADWRRCELLLDKCPEIRAEFHRMAYLTDVWKRLVENWDKIRKSFIEEAPDDWRDPDSNWMASKTYDLMDEIIDNKGE